MTLLDAYMEVGDIVRDPDTNVLFWPKDEFWKDSKDTPVRADTIASMTSREIVIPPGIRAKFKNEYWWDSYDYFRRPYYQLRGKPVTREEQGQEQGEPEADTGG